MAKRKGNRMIGPTVVMGALAVILFTIAYRGGDGQHVAGVRIGITMLVQIAPLLIFAFVVAGMVQVLIPQELVARWIGSEAGWKGLLIGSAVGGLTPGGPYVSFPVLLGLMRTGASIGTGVAFVTAWSLWAVARLPLEVGILGWKFTLARLASSFVFPPIAGWIAQMLFGHLRVT